MSAFCDALRRQGIDVSVLDYSEHAMSSGDDATAAAFVGCAIAGEQWWDMGIDEDIVNASLRAIISAVNRASRQAA